MRPRKNSPTSYPKFLSKNFKVVAIAESFRFEDGFSVYAGVRATRDAVVEDAAFAVAKIGGKDGTGAAENIIAMLMRPDVSILMLDGCIVSFYNWIDGEALYAKFQKPVACYVFEEPEGRVEEAVKKLFPDWPERLRAIERLGSPIPYYTKAGYKIYVRSWGIDPVYAGKAAELAMKLGKMPEPLRVARIMAAGARALLNTLSLRLLNGH
ncbi:hypothetical protein Pogu_2336 [Pyrobaculum oguniense TE7]|uniref:UPF0215 protein Pogu_2336 n=1 Tax=Pyrobaculum oguniense (strain DSM 13380 / JCM 10595 / TE7) TaxID=698757 RepID=H6QBL2_PYROT|nr:hypothetical protein Pogu_2336 [Pyrobaculum oguniense TE7]